MIWMRMDGSSSFWSSSSSFSTSSFSSFFSWWSLSSLSISLFSFFSSFFFSSFPRLLGQELSFALEWGLVACGFLLFFSWGSGKNNFDNGEESFFFDFEETFLSWHVDINNFSFIDGNDLMKTSDLSSEDFSNPQSFLD